MRALQIHAGPRALRHLRERGLAPGDIAAVPAAAGGPKGLALVPLDAWLFGEWLPRGGQVLHLIGASIGAWRMAAACLPDPAEAFRQLAEAYITQDYPHAPGRMPAPRDVSTTFLAMLQRHLGGRETALLAHPRHRLHVFTSRGRHLLGREGWLPTRLGYLGAYAANALSRRATGAWIERVVFSDPRDPLPFALHDYRTRSVPLSAENLAPALLASCSIPFWLEPVRDIPGAPPGSYVDGGITDYHLHLNYASMHDLVSLAQATAAPSLPSASPGAPSLVLYPHFQRQIVPGWLDKGLRHRHRATALLDNVVVLAPDPAWVRTLPGGKLPDREDFRHWIDDVPARIAAWRRAVAECERLRDEFAARVERPGGIEATPL